MFRFRLEVALRYLLEMLPYLWVTFAYTLGALLIGLIFGALLAFFKLRKNRLLRAFAVGYTALMQSIPSIVLMFLVYYVVPSLAKQWFGITISKDNVLGFTILALGLFNTAVLSETMKSAYLSVPKGQYDGAICNGVPPFHAIVRILLPQATLAAIPNIGNSIVRLIKEGSLAYTIGLVDIMGYAYIADGKTLQNDKFEIYICLAAVYWVVSILIDHLFKYAEKGLSYGSANSKAESRKKTAV